MKYIKPFIITTILLFYQYTLAQDYTHPLDFNMLLSGTFGELRTNHFHAVIDIKTEGVEGQKIRAIADGYVSSSELKFYLKDEHWDKKLKLLDVLQVQKFFLF